MTDNITSGKGVIPETHKSIFLCNIIGLSTGLMTAIAISAVGLFGGAAGVAGNAQTAAYGRHFAATVIPAGGLYATVVLITAVISQIKLSRRWAMWPLYALGLIVLLVIGYLVIGSIFFSK